MVADRDGILSKSPQEIQEIAKRMKQFRLDAELLSESRRELLRQYPNQWASAFEGKIILASTQDELLRKLGGNSRYAPWAYLNPNPKTFILLAAA